MAAGEGKTSLTFPNRRWTLRRFRDDTLEQIAPVCVVRGNNDKEWVEHLPHGLTVQLENPKIFMVHNKKESQNLPLDMDIVIFGHAHKCFE